MLNTGSGVESIAPDDVTNRFALAIVAAKVLAGDPTNADKWKAVDECYPFVSKLLLSIYTFYLYKKLLVLNINQISTIIRTDKV
jgi:hypothetical protein